MQSSFQFLDKASNDADALQYNVMTNALISNQRPFL